MDDTTWRDVPFEEAIAPLTPPDLLLGRRVRLSNPESGVTTEGRCDGVGYEVTFGGTRPVFTVTTDDGGRADYELREPGTPTATPEFATRLEVQA